MANIKITTKPEFKQGYEAAQANQPRKSPYRPETNREELWLAGYNAFQSGSSAPEEPRKRRTKAEMVEAKSNPLTIQNFNDTSKPLPTALVIKRPEERLRPTGPREDGLFEKFFKAKKDYEEEGDPELRELMYMEAADLEWVICVLGGPKPSDRWEEYKKERGICFDKTAA